MKKEYDFSRGERGKFYRRGVELSFPVYLQRDIAKALQQRATQIGSSVEAVVNDWLRKEIRSGRQPKLKVGRRGRA